MRSLTYSFLKYSVVLISWFCIDDRVAAHFSNPDIGTVPFWMAFVLVFIVSSIAEQKDVMEARNL